MKLLWGLIEANISIPEKIKEKLASGRYYLTLVGGIVFAYAVWKRILPDAATSSILTSIFVSYFSRSDRGANGQGQPNRPT